MTELILPLAIVAFAVLGGLWTARLTRYKGPTYIWKWDKERREMVPDEPVKAGHCKNHPE